MQALTEALIQLRATVVRESVGVDSPVRKLGALDHVMGQHSASILGAMKTARTRHSGVLAADDAMRVLYAIVTNVTMLNDWLQTASIFKRLPSGPPENRELSEAKSRDARESRLAMVKGRTAVAFEMIEDLKRVALVDPAIGPNVTKVLLLLASLRTRLRCNEINSTVAARFRAGRRYSLPGGTLRLWHDELKEMASSDEFRLWDDAAKSAVWQSQAIVSNILGDELETIEALTNCRNHTGGSPEDRIQAIVNVLTFSTSDIERLSLVTELERLERERELGSVFSRERMGKISMLRDSFAALAARANTNDTAGRALSQACFDVHALWLFGVSLPPEYPVIRIAASWQGEGRVCWRLGDEVKSRQFRLDPTLVSRFIVNRETKTTSANTSIWRQLLEHQDRALSAPITEAMTDVPGAGVQAIGIAADLPLSALTVGDSRLGTQDSFGYIHPLAGRGVIPWQSLEWHPDLLVIDRAIGDEARAVIEAARFAESSSGDPIRVMEFDSKRDGRALERPQLVSGLVDSSDVILYCHGVSSILNASGAGLLIGRGDTLTVEEIAHLDLRNIRSLALIACSSGRSNPFVGQITVAHAMAVAGVSAVAFTQWPILQKRGAIVAKLLLAEDVTSPSLSTLIAGTVDAVDAAAAAFSVVRA